jgi:hypothetical protein
MAGERKGGCRGQLVWSAFRCQTGRSGAARMGRVGCLPSSLPPGIAAGKGGRNRVGHNQSINQRRSPGQTAWRPERYHTYRLRG